MKWSKTLRLCVLLLTLSLQSLPQVGQTAAIAQDVTTEGLWLSLNQFGYPSPIRLSGQFGERFLYLPIPPGMQAEAMKFTLRVSADVESGFLEIYNREHILQTLTLESSPQAVEFELRGAQVESGYLVLRLISRLRSQDDLCETAYVGAWLNIEDAALKLSGQPAQPQTVAEFFPPLLTDLIVETPPPLQPEQAEAVLRLVASLQAKYAAQPFTLLLVTNDQEIPAEIRGQPLARRVVVRQGPQASIVVQNGPSLPTLVLQGQGQALSTHSAWLSSSFQTFGISRQVQVLEWKEPSQVGSKTVTLADLGYPLQQVSGVGQLDISISFSQADLGGSVRNLYARLVGTYTPIEALASATLTVLFNGAQVRSQLLSNTTQYDLYLSLPNSLLRRENTLTLRFDYTPRQGECRIGVSPFTAQLWENSYLQFEAGDTLPVGFYRFPQQLLPEFAVTLEPLTVDNLRRATELVMALQKLSKKPLHLSWADWQTAQSSRKSWLIVQSDPAQLAALKPPLEMTPFRIVDVSGRELLRLEGESAFAALQAFEHNQRQVLLLTARGQAELMDELLRHLGESPNGWYDLAGDVYLLGQGMSSAVGIDVRGGAVRVEPLQPSASVWLYRLRPYLFGAALLLLLALLVWLYPKLVRKQPVTS
ncbi:MAG: hypothetical protein DDG59_07130 [Anaerolineae bacterium]|nr:MAG: hypothetical protein DDG59_07130 [Anaerolineae bacterium]